MVMKPRLLHLLSLDVLLPPTASHPVRLASLSTSLPHAPSATHTVFSISLSGFLLEGEAGGAACRLTQLSHLGDAALWCPAAVVRLVASSLVPRSLKAVAKAAQAYQPERGAAEAFAAEVRDEAVSGADRRLPKSLETIVAQVERITADAQPAAAPSSAPSTDLPEDSTPAPSSTETRDHVSDAPSSKPQAATAEPEPPIIAGTGGADAIAQRRADDEPSQSTEVHMKVSGDVSVAAPRDTVAASDDVSGPREADNSVDTTSPSVAVEQGEMAESGGALGGEELTCPSSPASAPSLPGEEAVRLPRLRVATAAEPGLTSEHLEAALRRMTRVLSFVEADSVPRVDPDSTLGSDQLPVKAEALQELFADAVHMQLQSKIEPSATPARPLSRAQQEAHRLSTMLLLGGDALALAIAPGARESHAHVPAEGAEPASPVEEAASSSVLPGSPMLAGADSARVARGSTTAPSQRSKMSSASRQSLDTRSTSMSPHSSPALGSESGVSQAGSSTSWGSSLAHAPYTLALGMMALSSVVFAPGKAEGSFVSAGDSTDAACLSAARMALEAAAKRSTAGTGRQISAKPPSAHAPSSAPAASPATYSPSNVKLHPFPASLGKSSGGAVLPPLRLKARALERAPERGTLFEEDVRAPNALPSAPRDADQQPAAAPGYVAWLASYLAPSR
jgi:hypothetical protein